ncbi:MAG: polysaccharide deacetylase family protein [Anaerolineales bacterium]|nr:polysaccharide deacetylase family protein [Anaerolineales bacterium]
MTPYAPVPFRLTVLMYHYLRDLGDDCEAGSGIGGWPPSAFEAHLERACRAYHPVSWADVQAHLAGQAALPPRALLITFDDGLLDHYLNAFPRLQAAGLSGLFFALARRPGDGLTHPHRLHFLLARLGLDGLRAALLARLAPHDAARLLAAEAHYRPLWSDPVDGFKTAVQRELAAAVSQPLAGLLAEYVGDERSLADRYYLNAEQVAAMRAGGMHFGGHSQTHPWLDFVSAAQAAAEAAASAAWLRPVERGPFAFAYPYGGCDERTAAHLAAAGFGAAFTTNAGAQHASPYHIGRYDGEALPAGFFEVPHG